MVDITRPEYGQVWASQGETLEPVTTKMELGWVQEMMPFQWENFLQNRQDVAITYLLQKGIPEYSATQEYIAQKSVVLYQGAVYLATQTVTNVLPSVASSWKRVSTISDASGVVSVAGGGTGATTATQARTNLGLGTASTLNADVVVQKDENGNFSAGVITAALAGNAASADKLKTARTLQVSGVLTSTPTLFDGSSNLSIPVISVDASGLIGTAPASVLVNAVTKTSSTGSALLPSGTTAQRDSPADEAHFRYNKTTKLPEYYDGVGWKSVTGLNSGNLVEKTSTTGAAYLPAGNTSERPEDVPENVFAARLNTETGQPEWWDSIKAEWVPFVGQSGNMFDIIEYNGPVTHIPVGTIPANGQDWFAATYPDTAAALESGAQFMVSELLWQTGITGSPDYYKGCWSSGGTDGGGRRWYRAPKLNADVGYRAPFLRGSQMGVDAGALIDDRMRDHAHATQWIESSAVGADDNIITNSSAGAIVGNKAIATRTPQGTYTNVAGSNGNNAGKLATSSGVVSNGLIPLAATGPENSPRYHGVIMCIRMFGTVSNPGSVDAAQLATDLGVANAKISALEEELDGSLGFAIIYPNGGTALAPANVAINTRYVESNPFPGHVIVKAQVLYDGKWEDTGWLFTNGVAGYGVSATQGGDLDKIIVQTGGSALMQAYSYNTGGSYGSIGSDVVAPMPCRVKVWKVKGSAT